MEIIVSMDTAAGWDMIAYILLTVIAFAVAFRGWYQVLDDDDAVLIPEEIKLQ